MELSGPCQIVTGCSVCTKTFETEYKGESMTWGGQELESEDDRARRASDDVSRQQCAAHSELRDIDREPR